MNLPEGTSSSSPTPDDTTENGPTRSIRQRSNVPDDVIENEIRSLVDKYVASINTSPIGIDLASEVWLTSPKVEFIHPRGEVYGWDNVVREFYGQTMEANFSERALNIEGSPSIQRFTPDLVVVYFAWDFVATWRDGTGQLHTQGRETQVYADIDNLGWRIVHVHYSGPAVTGTGEGF